MLTAKVTCYAESNIYTNELFEKFENQYITAGVTDKEKAEKAAWYIGYATDYQEMQNDWMLLLFAKKRGLSGKLVFVIVYVPVYGSESAGLWQY